MGDEILRLTCLLFCLTFIIGSLNARTLSEETQHYDALFKTINQKRFGLTKEAIEQIKDPFVKASLSAQQEPLKAPSDTAPEAPTPPSLTLFGLLEDRANINAHWVRTGEDIQGYTLRSIQERSVTLTNAHHSLTLTLSHKGNADVIVVTKK